MKKLLKFFFGIPLTIVSFYFIVNLIYPYRANVWQNITYANPFSFYIGILFLFGFFVIRAITWLSILEKLGIRIPKNRGIFLLSLAETKRYIPGNIFSFIARAYHFQEYNISKRIFLASIFIEAIVFVLSAALISIPGMAFISRFANRYISLSLLFIIIALMNIIGFIVSIIIIKKKKFKLPQISIIFNFIPSFTFMIISWICFGIGNYLIASSFVLLDPNYIIAFSSLFVFSWLVGYISFITPLGFGIREGVLIAGLSLFVPLYLASSIAIVTRIVLMGSEVLFLGCAYVVQKIRIANKIFLFISPQAFTLLLLMSLYIGYVGFVTIAKHNNFYTGRFDLGNMDQTVWNTKEGRIFELTNPNGDEIMSRLGIHADFILIALSLFYFIWDDPRTLLIIQTIVIAVGAIFIYKISELVLKRKTLSLTLAFAYLISPQVLWQNFYDFHAVALSTTFLLATFYFLVRKRYMLFVMFLILALSTKENLYLISAVFGGYLFFHKKRKFGLILAAVSLIIFYLLIAVIMPQFRGGDHFALAYFSDFGPSPLSIIQNIILKPQLTLNILFSSETLIYYVTLFTQTGFLALLSPLYLLFAVPDLGINTLSSNQNFREIYYQYQATIIPFLFIASIYGVSYLLNFKKKILSWQVITAYILFFSLFSAWRYSPLPGTNRFYNSIFTKKQPYLDSVRKFIQSIPQDKRVAATNNLGAQLSHRRYIYVLPNGIEKADYVLFLDDSRFYKLIKDLEKDSRFTLIYKENKFVAFKRNR